MRAGRLRHRVTIQSVTTNTDSYGQPIESWSTFAEVWAAVEPLTGREYFQAQQLQAEVTYRVRIRYLTGVLPTMRVLHDSRTFEVQAVINLDERNRELHLMCREVDSGV